MVRANRPWRLTARLFRALIAALATVAFALVTSDVWRLSESTGPLRLAALMLLSIGITVGSLIAVHDLWERSRPEWARRSGPPVQRRHGDHRDRRAGIALSRPLRLGAGRLGTADHAGRLCICGFGLDLGDYLDLAWLVSSLATVAGALGAGLEATSRFARRRMRTDRPRGRRDIRLNPSPEPQKSRNLRGSDRGRLARFDYSWRGPVRPRCPLPTKGGTIEAATQLCERCGLRAVATVRRVRPGVGEETQRLCQVCLAEVRGGSEGLNRGIAGARPLRRLLLGFLRSRLRGCSGGDGGDATATRRAGVEQVDITQFFNDATRNYCSVRPSKPWSGATST